jgi:hypothetical protein
MKEESGLADLIKPVGFRSRETRRSGRGKFSQLIMSNKALCQLLVDIFNATQSLMDVRTVRLLALSRIAVEDSRVVSIDAEIAPQRSTQSRPYRIELADKRPTPEQNLLDREAARELDDFAETLISMLKQRVRNKTRRFSTLVKVVWYSYFDPMPRSPGEIAALIGVSYSLVYQYRKLFDSYVKKIDLPAERWVILNRSIEIKLASIMADLGPVRVNQESRPDGSAGPQPVGPSGLGARSGILDTDGSRQLVIHC